MIFIEVIKIQRRKTIQEVHPQADAQGKGEFFQQVFEEQSLDYIKPMLSGWEVLKMYEHQWLNPLSLLPR